VILWCSLASDTNGCELFCETANKNSTDIQERVFLDQMGDCKLHKEECVPLHVYHIDQSASRSGFISKVPCITRMLVSLLFNAL